MDVHGLFAGSGISEKLSFLAKSLQQSLGVASRMNANTNSVAGLLPFFLGNKWILDAQ